jgi:hypothetical protein
MFDIQVDASRSNVRLEEEEVRDAQIVAVTLVAGDLEEARNIIHSAFDEMKPEIIENLERAVLDVVSRPIE